MGRHMIRALFAGLTILLSCTLAFAQEYRVQEGDTLSIEVLEDPSLNRQVLVLPDGNVSFPFVGNLRAEDRTLAQIQSGITDALAPNFASRPTVFVTLSRLRQSFDDGGLDNEDVIFIYFIGEVNNPGRVGVEAGTTLLQALAVSGGLTDFAATKRIQLRRNGTDGQEVVYSFDYKAISEGAQITGTTTVVDGDVILIPQRRLFE